MIDFFFNAAPNPLKVGLFLEESGLEYRAIPIDTKLGQQHTDGYRAINPNSKVPAIDDDGTVVFDSNAILLYLAEKIGKFLPPADERGALLSWLMFVASGVGPYSGQAVHFRNFAPEKIPYAIKRYDRYGGLGMGGTHTLHAFRQGRDGRLSELNAACCRTRCSSRGSACSRA